MRGVSVYRVSVSRVSVRHVSVCRVSARRRVLVYHIMSSARYLCKVSSGQLRFYGVIGLVAISDAHILWVPIISTVCTTPPLIFFTLHQA